MRISDWSRRVLFRSGDVRDLEREHLVVNSVRPLDLAETMRETMALLIIPHRSTDDRKSVVLGKSVSVSVDLGGRRIIKRQTNPQRSTCSQHLKSQIKRYHMSRTQK